MKAATDKLTNELPKVRASCPLSPRERVRVRASVTTNFFPSINFLFPHNPRPRVCWQRMRRTFLQRVENHITYELLLSLQLPVPETNLFDAHRGEKFCSLDIASLLVGMPVVSAIEFDGEARLHAIEVEVVNPAWVITAELVSRKAPVTQPTPHQLFSPRLFLTQSASAFYVGHGGRLVRCGRFEKNGLTTALTPALSPRRGRIICRSSSYWMVQDCSTTPRQSFNAKTGGAS